MPSSEDKIVRSFYDLPMTTQPSNLLCREAAQFNQTLQRTGHSRCRVSLEFSCSCQLKPSLSFCS
jgi:hypothetical protein